MKKAELNAMVVLPIIILIGVLLALAGSQAGSQVGGFPVFALCIGVAFAIQWLAFVPAFLFQSEKFFDLTGSLTYLTVTILAVILSANLSGRSLLLLILVSVWAVRLGSFLFRRVRKAGKDDRFDELKPSFFRFLNVWTIQGLWVSFTLAAALTAITTSLEKGLDLFALVGTLIWAVGFGIEVVADAQKSKFTTDPGNKGKFISSGLWSRSRHPNYFGEIVLWIGIAIIVLPVLQGWQWVTLISPLFVIMLLTKVSGIPLLEKKADTKWGGQPEYEAYKKNTPVLIPRVGRERSSDRS